MEGEGGVIRMKEDGLFLVYAQVIAAVLLQFEFKSLPTCPSHCPVSLCMHMHVHMTSAKFFGILGIPPLVVTKSR